MKKFKLIKKKIYKEFKFKMKSFILICIITKFLAKISIDSQTNNFIDEHGRTTIFHGVNAVYKIPPFIPLYDRFDSNNSLSD